MLSLTRPRYYLKSWISSRSRAANLFTREWVDDKQKIKFGEHYKGGRKQIAVFDNNAYLSKAGNTPDAPEIVKSIFNSFRIQLHVGSHLLQKYPTEFLQSPKIRPIMNTFLGKADLGIKEFKVEEVQIRQYMQDMEAQPPESLKDIEELFNLMAAEERKLEFFYHHTDAGDTVRFTKSQESKGTIKAFELMPFIAQVLETGRIYAIDEIESSLHPHMAEMIIKLFNDPEVNKKNAQLIFTTHNLSLMSPQTMRKDQIYLTEKTIESGTELANLEDFDNSLKDTSPFAKWYDEGRLGAIPSINYRDIADAIIEAM